MRGAARRMREQSRYDGQRDVALAYTIGQFNRADPAKLQPLAHYLPRDQRAGRAPMLDQLKAIAARTEGLAA